MQLEPGGLVLLAGIDGLLGGLDGEVNQVGLAVTVDVRRPPAGRVGCRDARPGVVPGWCGSDRWPPVTVAVANKVSTFTASSSRSTLTRSARPSPLASIARQQAVLLPTRGRRRLLRDLGKRGHGVVLGEQRVNAQVVTGGIWPDIVHQGDQISPVVTVDVHRPEICGTARSRVRPAEPLRPPRFPGPVPGGDQRLDLRRARRPGRYATSISRIDAAIAIDVHRLPAARHRPPPGRQKRPRDLPGPLNQLAAGLLHQGQDLLTRSVRPDVNKVVAAITGDIGQAPTGKCPTRCRGNVVAENDAVHIVGIEGDQEIGEPVAVGVGGVSADAGPDSSAGRPAVMCGSRPRSRAA